MHHITLEILAISSYFFILFGIVFFSRKKNLSQSDFIIGGRSMNCWMTALAAHASDMSNWLLMAYPGMVYLNGGSHLWVAIGLITMMWMNWTFVAPKIRIATEKSGSTTMIDFFEKRLGGHWPQGRLITSCVLLLFYTVYVSGMLFGLGFLVETLFGFSYHIGVLLGLIIILSYVLIGGYLTLAQIDLIQGTFLLGVLLFVSFYMTRSIGGVKSLLSSITAQGKSIAILSHPNQFLGSLFLMFGWGLGYFGQPHIISKFMGIKDVKEIKPARAIGISWQILSLGAASLIGFLGIAYFGDHLENSEQVFIQMVRQSFTPFLSGLFLCAIIAAVINAASSMLLILSTTFSEDLYARFIKKSASSREKLKVSRISTILISLIAAFIALGKFATIDQLVQYAWSGLGASFGPLLLISLNSKKLTPRGASIGMISGGLMVALWPLAQLDIPPLIVSFPFSLAVIWMISKKTVPNRILAKDTD